jgi:hypothetical protein
MSNQLRQPVQRRHRHSGMPHANERHEGREILARRHISTNSLGAPIRAAGRRHPQLDADRSYRSEP